MLSWVIENTVLATGLALVLLACSRWLEKRPAIGNFGWLMVIVVVVMPPMPSVVSPAVRDTLMTPVSWAGGLFERGETKELNEADDRTSLYADWRKWEAKQQPDETRKTDEAAGYESEGEKKAEQSVWDAEYGDVSKPLDSGLSLNAFKSMARARAVETDEPRIAVTPPLVWPASETGVSIVERVSVANVASFEIAERSEDQAQTLGEQPIVISTPSPSGPKALPRSVPVERGESVLADESDETGVSASPAYADGSGVFGGAVPGEPVRAEAVRAFPWALVLTVAGVCGSVVWLVGVVVVARRQGLRVCSMRSLEKTARRDPALERRVGRLAKQMGVRAPRTIVSDQIDGPMVWNLGRSVLVWPASIGVDAPGADGMIAHELAHLRRGDHWFAWVELAALTLFWWHPLVWMAHRRAREFAELACDAWVAWVLPADRRVYAEALVHAATQRTERKGRGGPALAFGVVESSKDDFKRRLTMVMTGRGSRRLPPAFAAAGMGLVMMLAPSLAGEFGVEGPVEVQIEGLDLIDEAFHPALQRMALLEDAERFEKSDQFEQAAEAYREAIELGADAQEDLAMLYYWSEDYEAGVEAFVEAFEEDDDADLLYNAACCAALGGNQSDAVKLLKRAVLAGYTDGDHLMSDSDLESVHSRDEVKEIAALASTIEELEDLAREASSEGAWGQAAKAYAKLAELVSGDRSNVMMAAYCCIMDGDLETGRQWLETQMELEYAVETAMYNMACVESLDGNESAALRWLGEAVGAGFDSHELMRGDDDLAAIRGSGEFDELVRAAARPERLRREMELAAEFWDWDVVIDNAEELIDIDQKGWGATQARQMLAKAYEHQGEFGEAIDMLLENAESGKNTHGTMLAIARNYAKDGRLDKGAAYLAVAIETGGKHSGHKGDESTKALEAHPSVIAAYARQRDRDELAQFDASSWGELESVSREELVENAESGSAYLTLGWSLLRQLKLDEAVDAFEKLGEFGSEQLSAYNIACCYAVGGNSDEAFEYLGKAVEAGFSNPGQYADDPDLKSLHDDSRWEELIGSMKVNARDEGEWGEYEVWDDGKKHKKAKSYDKGEYEPFDKDDDDDYDADDYEDGEI